MSNYPNQIDTNAELPAVHDNISEVSTGLLNAIRDTLITIETTLGLNPQGAALDLVSRLGVALNADGTIKSGALPSTLIDLPITNSQIGASAAIEESKLDLDVPTQTLSNQIASNDIDIANLQRDLASLLLRFVRHVTGVAERHNSSHIAHTLVDGYVSGSGTTVKTALNYLSGLMDLHRSATTGREHWASAIEYIPGESIFGTTSIITAQNVQDAIDQIDASLLGQLRTHSDEAHSNGVSNDGYIALGGQALVNDASLQLTRYTPVSGEQLIKIGHANAATVKTKGFTAGDLSASAKTVLFQVAIGTSTRVYTVTNLETAAFPSGVGRPSLLGIVDACNASFATDKAPLSAFASADGELVIQHNIARDDCTIEVQSPGPNSAIAALGFTDIVNVEVGRFENYTFTVDGNRFTDLKQVLTGSITQGVLNVVVDIGVAAAASGIRTNMLFHVFSHSNSAGAGTYRIDGLSGTQLTLNSALAAGTLDYVIYEDTMNTTDIVTNRHVLDFYLDDTRTPVTSDRAEIVFGGVQGVRIVEVSQDFPGMTGTFSMTTSGTQKSMQITDTGSSVTGTSTLFDPGFIGYLKVYAPNNVAYTTVLVNDITPVNGTDTFTVITSEIQDDRLFLGTTFHNGLTVVELPVSKTSIGLVGNSSIATEFLRDVVETDLDAFHLSGVTRGFDIISTTSTSVKVRGGTAYIGGRKIEKPTQDLDALNYATSDGTWNLVLTRQGTLEIYEESTGTGTSFPVSDILLSEDLILLAQITVSGAAVTDTLDARFLVNDIESRLQLTVDDRDLGAGSFRSLEAAVLYSQNAPNDAKPEITVLSDLTFSDTLTVNSGSRIVSFGDLTFDSNLVLSSNSTLQCFGSLNVTGTVTLNTGARLEALDGGVLSSAMTLNDDCTFVLDGYMTAFNISGAGSRVSILGVDRADRSTLHFGNTSVGISVSGGAVTDFLVKDLKLVSATGLSGTMLLGSITNCRVENVDISQATTLTLAQITNANRYGINFSSCTNTVITRCNLSNLGRGIVSGSVSNFTISECTFEDIDLAIDIDFIFGRDFEISNNRFTSMHTGMLLMDASNERGIISGNQASGTFDLTSAPTMISGAGARELTISNNIFSDISGVSIISLPSSSESCVVDANIIKDCTTTGFAIDVGTSSPLWMQVSNNVMDTHVGPAAKGSFASFTGNVLFSDGGGTITAWDFATCQVSGNYITNSGTLDGVLSLNNTTFVGNRCNIGSATVTGGVGTTISGNDMFFFDTAVAYSLEVDNPSTTTAIVGNQLGMSSTTTGLRVNRGNVTIGNNFIRDVGGSFASAVSIDTTSAGEWVIVSDNIIDNGTTYGVFIDSNEVIVQGNIAEGAVAGGGGDFVAANTRADILITNNVANGTGGDARRAFTFDTSADNVFISLNKGALEKRTYSPYAATLLDAWDVTLNGIENEVQVSAPQQLIMPLSNLHVGANLESVDVNISNGGGLGAATAHIYRRTSSSLTAASASAVTDVAPGAFQILNVPRIGGPTEIDPGEEYFIVIDIPSSLAAATIIVGQISVNYII